MAYFQRSLVITPRKSEDYMLMDGKVSDDNEEVTLVIDSRKCELHKNERTAVRKTQINITNYVSNLRRSTTTCFSRRKWESMSVLL